MPMKQFDIEQALTIVFVLTHMTLTRHTLMHMWLPHTCCEPPTYCPVTSIVSLHLLCLRRHNPNFEL